MMKNIFILFLSIFLVACSTSDDEVSVSEPQLTTKEIILDGEGFMVLGGQVTNSGGNQIYRSGVVWSTSSNVSLDNYNDKEEQNSNKEDFEIKSKKTFIPNTTYYFKAYAQNNTGLSYGNTVTFKVGKIVETLDPTEITTVSAALNGRFYQPLGNRSYTGFVYATHSEPTIFDNGSLSTDVIGTMNYKIQLNGLVRNTQYYIRSYTKIGSKYYYGEEKKIKTAGYFGPAGGIVAYDKGVSTDGWRYLEISNKDVGRNYAEDWGYRFGAIWSKSPQSYLAGTSEKMGDGPSNTDFIISKIPGESAAKFCKQHSANGYSDWFLPSKEEAVVIITSLQKGGMSLNSGLTTWTSSEINTTQAHKVSYNGIVTGAFVGLKYGDDITYPVRRY